MTSAAGCGGGLEGRAGKANPGSQVLSPRQMLTLQVDPFTDEAELQKEGLTIRNMVLEPIGAKKRRMLPEDEQAINQLWMKQFLKRNRNGKGNSRSRTQEQATVEIRLE